MVKPGSVLKARRPVSLGRKLLVQTSCQSFRRHQYQHIAVDDVDGDGDLDVFFAGLNRQPLRKSGQCLSRRQGLGNLMFINDGGFRFREVAERGGFRATTTLTWQSFLTSMTMVVAISLR